MKLAYWSNPCNQVKSEVAEGPLLEDIWRRSLFLIYLWSANKSAPNVYEVLDNINELKNAVWGRAGKVQTVWKQNYHIFLNQLRTVLLLLLVIPNIELMIY
jgi:hypothetical protein